MGGGGVIDLPPCPEGMVKVVWGFVDVVEVVWCGKVGGEE